MKNSFPVDKGKNDITKSLKPGKKSKLAKKEDENFSGQIKGFEKGENCSPLGEIKTVYSCAGPRLAPDEDENGDLLPDPRFESNMAD